MKKFLVISGLLFLFSNFSFARENNIDNNRIKTTDEHLGHHSEENRENIDRYRESAGRGADRVGPAACEVAVGAATGAVGGAIGGAIGAAVGVGGGVCGGHR